MKNFLLIAFFVPLFCFGQRVTEYKAINNVTYHVGDTIKLGKGSNSINGSFMFVQIGGVTAVLSYDSNSSDSQLNVSRAYNNSNVIIKKIRLGKKINGVQKCNLVVDNGQNMTYNIAIDDAIQTCEVIPCNKS